VEQYAIFILKFSIYSACCFIKHRQKQINYIQLSGNSVQQPPGPLLAVVEMAKIVGWTLAYLGKTLGLDNKRKAVI